VGKLSHREGDDVLDEEPVGLRAIQVRQPLVGPAPRPRPDAPRAITARDIALAAIVSLVSTLAVIAFFRFGNTPPAPATQRASAPATRMVDAAPADDPASPAAAQPAATALAAPKFPSPPTTPTVFASAPADTRGPAAEPQTSALAPADARMPPAEPQASEPRRALRPEERQAMASLVARGKELLRNGDFSSARLILERAANAGEAEAALTLGSAYDPVVLARLGMPSQVANIDLARTWYEKAQEFGSTEASARLKTLPNY